jgi:hypothetical protein
MAAADPPEPARADPPAADAAPPREPFSLADTLRACTDAELGALLHARPDLIRPLPDDLADLAARAASPYSVRLAWERLDRLQQQILEVLVALRVPASPAQLHAALGTADPAVAAALSHLRAAALVWGPTESLRPVATVGDLLGPAPCGLDPVDRAARPRIAAHLADPRAFRAEVDSAPAGVRDLLDQLLWAPHGSVANADRTVTPETARTPVEWLLARDLLVPEGPRSVVLPREVALLLRDGRYVRDPALPPPPPVQPGAALVPDADATAGLQALLTTRAVRRLLDVVEEGALRLLRSGGVYQRDGADLARRLLLAPADAALLADTAVAAGLVTADAGAGRWGVTAASDAWRVLPEPAAWAALVLGWLDSPRHPGGEPGRLLSEESVRPGVAELRRFVLAAAARTPSGAPLAPAAVAEHVRWRRPRRAAQADELVPEVLEAAEVLGLLGRGALTDAGRAAAVLPADGDATALADAVRWPSMVPQLLFQADLTATSFGPLTAEAERRIERLADLESAGAGTVYRLSAASLERAFDDGLAGAEVLAEITALSATPVPSTLSTLVADVARRHGSVVVHSAASVVTSDDDAALAAAVADRTLAGLRLRRVAPGVVISSAPHAEVVAALRRAGVAAVGAQGAQRRRAARLPAGPAVAVDAIGQDWVDAAVRAVRTGERARLELAENGRARPVGPHELVAAIGAAIRDRRHLWLDVADTTGQRRVRLVEPLALRTGMLSGYDHREQRVMGFPLSRIIGLAPVDRDDSR